MPTASNARGSVCAGYTFFKRTAVGTLLSWHDRVRPGYAINYGIKTGFNEAFIIDKQTKEALIAEDPRSADIIKPVVRGRDIQRYKARWYAMAD